jgi:hypothetical protein
MLLQKHEAIARELEWQQQQLAAALEHPWSGVSSELSQKPSF